MSTPAPPTKADPASDPHAGYASMPLGDHLEDLRRRIILGLVGLVPLFIGALMVGQWLLGILIIPAQNALRDRGLPAVLQVTGPLEMFSAYVRVALIITVAVGSPWLLWQIWRFIRPGLYENERRFIRILAPLSAGLTAASAAFLYYLMLPVVLIFFIGFSQSIGVGNVDTNPPPADIVFPTIPALDADPTQPEPGQFWINTDRMELRLAIAEGDNAIVRAIPLTSGTGVAQQFRVYEYVKLILNLALGLSLAFQMPVVVLLLGWASVVTPEFLAQYRRYALMILAVLSAVLTPADPLSMMVMLIPLYGLYELGILLLRWMPAGERPEASADA